MPSASRTGMPTASAGGVGELAASTRYTRCSLRSAARQPWPIRPSTRPKRAAPRLTGRPGYPRRRPRPRCGRSPGTAWPSEPGAAGAAVAPTWTPSPRSPARPTFTASARSGTGRTAKAGGPGCGRTREPGRCRHRPVTAGGRWMTRTNTTRCVAGRCSRMTSCAGRQRPAPEDRVERVRPARDPDGSDVSRHVAVPLSTPLTRALPLFRLILAAPLPRLDPGWGWPSCGPVSWAWRPARLRPAVRGSGRGPRRRCGWSRRVW